MLLERGIKEILRELEDSLCEYDPDHRDIAERTLEQLRNLLSEYEKFSRCFQED